MAGAGAGRLDLGEDQRQCHGRDWRGVGKEEETSRCGDIYRDGNITVE
jgi:hypothetical protein